MKPLGAVDAAELLLATAEAGGAAAAAAVVGGTRADLMGRRLALTRTPAGDFAVHGSLGSAAVDEAAAEVLRETLATPRVGDGLRTVQVGADALELYLEVRWPVQELVIVGAGHIALPMAHIGSTLGFRVTVLDDRPDFATRERFPTAHKVVRADFSDPFADIPLHERSHILLVTRGHKYDYECLIRALRADPPPAYIGMIGSRRRVRATYVQLVEEGFSMDLIDRIHAPVGLDVGAETPEEIAVAVAAELVMVRRGGTGLPLKGVERVAERYFAGDLSRKEGEQ
ncbi:MAG: XdhC family protein [Gemmatimonadales bacterium]